MIFFLKGDDKGGLETHMHKLYEKYIGTGCKLELNISYAMRKELIVFFEIITQNEETQINVTKQQYFEAFDECCKEIKKLLFLAINRFVSTPVLYSCFFSFRPFFLILYFVCCLYA